MSESRPHITLFDTTLRDGTQGEGISFSVAAKLRVAERLDEFGIDYIEGGWPGSNPRDVAFFEAARSLTFKHAKLSAFGSTRRAGIAASEDPQLRLLLEAQTPAVTIFGKTWLLHVLEVLKTTPEENIAMIEDSVRFLKAAGRDLVYDAEHFFDGFKDSPDYALETLAAAARGGADWLTLCDTNGGTQVDEVKEIVRQVVARFPGKRIGVHCHNDCGLGVAVSLAGVLGGATMVQGTINGFGERTGNSNLTTVIPNLALKLGFPMFCKDKLSELRELSLFVDEMANFRPDAKAAFVGLSAFAHKGGVHANAAAKVARSYEHIDPTLVGNRQRVLVSDMAGRSSIVMKARELGLNVDEKGEPMKNFIEELKRLEFAGYEYEAADASLELLLRQHFGGLPEFFELLSYRVTTERSVTHNELISEATVKVRVKGGVYHEVAEANGPVGALDHALRKALVRAYPELNEVSLKDFKVRIVEGSRGADAVTRVQIDSTDGHTLWGTVGASDNIIEASYQALRDSLVYRLARSGRN